MPAPAKMENCTCYANLHLSTGISHIFPPFFFQFLVGMLLKMQPFFISGIPDYKLARTSAFGAMWAYIFTFCISVVLMIRDGRRKRRDMVLARASYGRPPPLGIQDYDVTSRDEETEGAFAEFT